MPTIPPRNFARARKNGSDNGRMNNFLLLDPTVPRRKSLSSNTEVTEVELRLTAGEEQLKLPQLPLCPAPQCKHTFLWSTIPKPICKKPVTRAPKELPPEPYKNVMYDRRVVRGTNFGGINILTDYDPLSRADEIRRHRALQRKSNRNRRNVLGTPPPLPGRHHEVMQTDKYLESIDDHVAEFSVDTQTDLFLERPPTPPYIPAKVGVDVGTEIEEGELFHFDAEAQPIIDILVDACIEQTMLEVAHEREIEELHKKQEEYMAEREAELAKLRRLEAEESRLLAEKDRRLRQDAITKDLNDEMQKGITAAKLLQGHIAGLLPEVLDNLEPATDAVKKEKLMKTICPWLSHEVAEEVGQIVDSREILTVIIQEIIKQRAEIYGGYEEEVPPEVPLPSAVFGEGEGEEAHDDEECCICESTKTCPSSTSSGAV